MIHDTITCSACGDIITDDNLCPTCDDVQPDPVVEAKKPEPWRVCSICGNDKGVLPLAFKTGQNSTTTIAYCKKHRRHLYADIYDIVNSSIPHA